MVTVTPKGRQDQQGNKIIWLPSASKATGSTDQGTSRAGEGEAEGAFSWACSPGQGLRHINSQCPSSGPCTVAPALSVLWFN